MAKKKNTVVRALDVTTETITVGTVINSRSKRFTLSWTKVDSGTLASPTFSVVVSAGEANFNATTGDTLNLPFSVTGGTNSDGIWTKGDCDTRWAIKSAMGGGVPLVGMLTPDFTGGIDASQITDPLTFGPFDLELPSSSASASPVWPVETVPGTSVFALPDGVTWLTLNYDPALVPMYTVRLITDYTRPDLSLEANPLGGRLFKNSPSSILVHVPIEGEDGVLMGDANQWSILPPDGANPITSFYFSGDFSKAANPDGDLGFIGSMDVSGGPSEVSSVGPLSDLNYGTAAGNAAPGLSPAQYAYITALIQKHGEAETRRMLGM